MSAGKPSPGHRVLAVSLPLLAFAMALSIAATEILLGVSILAWLATRPWTRPFATGVRRLGLVTLALAAAWILSSITAPVPIESFIKARKLYSIVLVFPFADMARDERLRGRVVTAALGGGIVTCGIGYVQFARDHLAGNWVDPLEGVFSTAMTSGNVLATLTIAALACVLWPRGGRALRAFDLTALAATFVGLLMTFRRSAYLGWLGGAIALVGLKRARFLWVLPVVIALALVFGPAYVRERVWLIVHPTDTTSVGRVSLWLSGWDAFRDRPITGWGLADQMRLIAQYRRPDATFALGHFHNNWVEIAVTTGVLGLVAFTAWMLGSGVLLWNAVRRRKEAVTAAALGAWIAFQIGGLFDWSFGDAEVANQFFLWTGLGLACYLESATRHHPPERTKRGTTE